jgi:phage terminase large subunit-like protein
MMRAGRGFGKTKGGAEAVRRRVITRRARQVGLVAPTAADARDVMVEGPSGILAVHPDSERPLYEPSKRKLTWPNGAVGHVYSADEPDRLRGPEHDLTWNDEPASWKRPEAWDNMQLGLRAGRDPRAIVTMTPKPLPWLRALADHRSTVTTGGATYENAANLADPFLADVLDRYEGTRLGRQELHGLFLDDVEGALWAMPTIEAHRVHGWLPGPAWQLIVAVDPPGETAECGIVVVAGQRGVPRGQAYVLDDSSLAGPPEVWAAQVVATVRRWGAEAAYVEANQGGDMVRAVIHAVDPTLNVRKITASLSKEARAQPVATAYTRGRVHHVGYFGMLESQMTTWVPREGKSPDRVDALDARQPGRRAQRGRPHPAPVIRVRLRDATAPDQGRRLQHPPVGGG